MVGVLLGQRLSSRYLRPSHRHPMQRRFTHVTVGGNPAVTVRPVVDIDWLKTKRKETTTKILDASWYLPATGRNAVEEFKRGHIPRAQFFDVNTIADRSVSLPHMLPNEKGFAAAADALKIEAGDHVVVYDGAGLFSAPRAWWMFKVFGHKNVSVLDGGFPAWKEAGLEVEETPNGIDEEIMAASIACKFGQDDAIKTRYPAQLDKAQVRYLDEMRELLETKTEQMLDARPSGRFNGTVPEAREGVRSGHIPGSLNIPLGSIITSDGRIKTKEELMEIIKAAGVDMKKDVACLCGSGVTACGIALILAHLGFEKHVAVYDGSWTEWGSRDDTPAEV